MKFSQLFTLILVMGLSSCLKEDNPANKPDPGEAVTLSVAMGADYRYQIWFDLGTESIVKTALKTDWDWALGSTAENDIYLNAAKFMMAAKTPLPFDAVNSTTNLTFRADDNSGNPDSLAFAQWQPGDVYVIDLGFTPTGTALGYIKVELIALTSGVLTFRYGPLDGSSVYTGQISQKSTYNKVAYSFASHQQLYAEPPIADWDLAFTQYTYIFYEPDYTPYLVTGVLNNTGVAVAVDKNKSFASITINDVAGYTFSNAQDGVGYDWKTYDFDLSTFTISVSTNYIIKDAEGVYYKLHFIDFYDSNGIKGTPKFELQRL